MPKPSNRMQPAAGNATPPPERSPQPAPSNSPPQDAQTLSRRLAESIRAAAPAIVEGLIASAQNGGFMAAKFLFDFAAIPPAGGGDGEQQETLLALLFRRLDEGSEDDGSGGGSGGRAGLQPGVSAHQEDRGFSPGG